MMQAFLLDTNVLSELMRAQPELQVIKWFDRHIEARCFTSSITIAEIFLGVALLRDCARRANLANKAENIFSKDFYGRCLPFDDQSAMVYAKLVSHIKSILETRPVYHKQDETILGHVFCSFLALVLRKELDQRLEKVGHQFEWEDMKRDLMALQEVTIEDSGRKLAIRTASVGTCGKVFQAVHAAIPQSIRNV